MEVVRRSHFLWAIYLLMSQLGTHEVRPAWPGPASAVNQNRQQLPLKADLLTYTTDVSRNAPEKATLRELLNELVRRVPICIVSTQPWAGDLGSSMLYRVSSDKSKNVHVGYFAYWTTERPWGDNTLTRWLLPALAIDAFYSHLLFLFPGIQRVMYGAGDVEGVRITYKLGGPDRLIPVAITADDDTHREVAVNVNDAVDDQGRVMLFNDVWSHQLGGRNARALASTGAQRRCFNGESLRPLTDGVVSAFRLGSPANPRRAGPAWGT